jgi:hypothetical protein
MKTIQSSVMRGNPNIT